MASDISNSFLFACCSLSTVFLPAGIFPSPPWLVSLVPACDVDSMHVELDISSQVVVLGKRQWKTKSAGAFYYIGMAKKRLTFLCHTPALPTYPHSLSLSSPCSLPHDLPILWGSLLLSQRVPSPLTAKHFTTSILWCTQCLWLHF